jgi:hypothetical protein
MSGSVPLQTSEFLASLIGPLFMMTGIGMLIDGRGYNAALVRFLESRPLIFIAGILTLVAGLAIVNSHNLWVADWRVIITVIGWCAAIAGALRILKLQKLPRVDNILLEKRGSMIGLAAVALVLGAVLSFYGYFR